MNLISSIRNELFSRKYIVMKILSFTLAFIILDTLITYYGISLQLVPAYVETSLLYRLYGLDAFLVGKLTIGSAITFVLYRNMRRNIRYYNWIVLGFASVSWFAVISNTLFIINMHNLLLPVAGLGLWLHLLWWITRPY